MFSIVEIEYEGLRAIVLTSLVSSVLLFAAVHSNNPYEAHISNPNNAVSDSLNVNDDRISLILFYESLYIIDN